MKIVFKLIVLLILTSCGQEDNSRNKDFNTNDSVEDTVSNKGVVIPTDLLSYFKDFTKDSLEIKVEQYMQESSFESNECLPLTYIPVFENKIPQNQYETSGTKPLGKIKINAKNFLLVVAQQDDYGPIYYGLTYNLEENKIKSSEKIAQIWGDEGDSQVTYSIVRVVNQTVKIYKFIETCQAELEEQGDEIIAKSVDCFDSTTIVEIKINE